MSFNNNINFQYLLDSSIELEKCFLSNDFTPKQLEQVRISAFKIEAFSRVLKKAFSKESPERLFAGELKTLSKYIEDQIGHYLYYYEMTLFTKKEGHQIYIKKSLTDFENSQKALQSKNNALLEQSLQIKLNLEFFHARFDLRELYIKGLKKELKSLHKKTKLISPKLLEDGTHELRRLLRWGVMHFVYPQNLFKYETKVKTTDKYTRLDNSQNIKSPKILIPYEEVQSLSSWVGELGQVKDAGLYENYINKSEDHNISQPDIIKLTKSILKKYKKQKTFKRLIQSLNESKAK